jgi:hypothetical protein
MNGYRCVIIFLAETRLRYPSTITERAKEYIIQEDVIEEMAYLIHQICYNAGTLYCYESCKKPWLKI